jgi:hypothetical protein
MIYASCSLVQLTGVELAPSCTCKGSAAQWGRPQQVTAQELAP